MPDLDEKRQRQAAEYARQRRLAGVINFALAAVLVGALVFGGLSEEIARWLPHSPIIGAVLYVILLTVGFDLMTLPLAYRTGYTLPRRYALSRQTASDWLMDHVKSLSMGAVFGGLAIAVVYLLIERSPNYWWLWAWAGLLLTTIVMTLIAPVVVLPLFYKSHLLADSELKRRLLEVAKKAGVAVDAIHIIELSRKTATANAAVMGLARTKRIVISDTLIDSYTPEEIEAVMAHELAHQRHHDVWRLFGYQAILFLGVFWLASWLFEIMRDTQDYLNINDRAALPLLLIAFVMAGAIALPLLSWFTRRREAAADAYSLELTRAPAAFISALARLTDQNLGEARPASFLDRLGQDHPSYLDRVTMANKFAGRAPNDNNND